MRTGQNEKIQRADNNIIFIRAPCIYFVPNSQPGPGMRYVRCLVGEKFYCRRNEIYLKAGWIRDRFSCEKFIGRNARPRENATTFPQIRESLRRLFRDAFPMSHPSLFILRTNIILFIMFSGFIYILNH